jgi:hypothetical protein
MPILPVDHPEPLAATLGVMLYPDPAENGSARAFAAQFLAEPIRRLARSGHSVSEEVVQMVIADLRGPFDGLLSPDDIGKRILAGTATGEMVKAYFTLAMSHTPLASWNHATQLNEEVKLRWSGCFQVKARGAPKSFPLGRTPLGRILH